MKRNLFIGIDGGGTKCKVRIEDEKEQLIGVARGGPANISVSTETAWTSILDAMKTALKDSGIRWQDPTYEWHAGLGLAGTENKHAVKTFLAYNPFTTLKLESDAYTACLGAHDAQDGAIIIIGTGVIGMSIHGKQITRVGGWGFPCSDEGSGAWLGFEAVRLTIQAFDGRIESSPLLEAIFQKFDRDIFELVSWAVASKSTHFAEIAPFVIQHLDQKDPWAVHLVKRAASEIDRLAETMFTRSKNNQLPCCLFGGLAPFIEPWLGKTLQARLTFRKNDANKGAIFMIKKHIGFSK